MAENHSGFKLLGNIDGSTNTYKCENMLNPTNAQDYATKNYIDTLNVENLPTSLTAGSVLFSDGTNIAQNNAYFFWDNTNKRLGLGSLSPISRLHLEGGVYNRSTLLMLNTFGGNTNYWIFGERVTTPTNYYFSIEENTNNRFTIKRGGDVGIGTITPGQKLEVQGNVYINGYVGIGQLTPLNKLHVEGPTYPTSAIRILNTYGSNTNYWTIGERSTDSSNYYFSIEQGANKRLVINQSGNVGIGTNAPATSAQVDITSTTGALLLPRMTTAQRDALTAVNGMMIYNSTTNAFNFRENGVWVTGSGLV